MSRSQTSNTNAPAIFYRIICSSRDSLRDLRPFVALFLVFLLINKGILSMISFIRKQGMHVRCIGTIRDDKYSDYIIHVQLFDVTSMIIASSSADQGARLMSGFRWLYHRSLHCLPNRPLSCLAMKDQLFIPCLPTSSQTLSSSCRLFDVIFVVRLKWIEKKLDEFLRASKRSLNISRHDYFALLHFTPDPTHLFCPGSFDQTRAEYFLPPMQALDICSTLKAIGYFLPVSSAVPLNGFS